MANLYRQYIKVIKHTALFDKEKEAKDWAISMIPATVERTILPVDGVWELKWTTQEVSYS